MDKVKILGIISGLFTAVSIGLGLYLFSHYVPGGFMFVLNVVFFIVFCMLTIYSGYNKHKLHVLLLKKGRSMSTIIMFFGQRTYWSLPDMAEDLKNDPEFLQIRKKELIVDGVGAVAAVLLFLSMMRMSLF